MKHKWRLDEDGRPDEWAWESGFHNGVSCESCGKHVCVHCHPDYMEMDDCTGAPVAKAKTNADRIRAMSEWISVKDRLPEPPEEDQRGAE